jgi:hypothetical protein
VLKLDLYRISFKVSISIGGGLVKLTRILMTLAVCILLVLGVSCGGGGSSNPVQMKTVHTTWNVVWKTLTDDMQWGSQVGTSQFPSTFTYDWMLGTVFGGLDDYIGFTATATINMQRPDGGPVEFTIGSNDGSNLYLDGTKIIDNWGTHLYDGHVRTAVVTLTYGTHNLSYVYCEKIGDAKVSFTCDADVLEWEEPAY